MDELKKLVSQQAGIDATQAKKAVDAVVAFAKKNLPPQYAGLVDTLITNPKAAQDMLKMLGGMMGQK